MNVIQLQTFPFEQVFFGLGIDGVEGTNTGVSSEAADRFAVLESDVHIHVGVGKASQNIDIDVVRKIVFKVTQRQAANVNASLVAERKGGDLSTRLEWGGFVEG